MDNNKQVRTKLKAAASAASLENARALITSLWQVEPKDSPVWAALDRIRNSNSLKECRVFSEKLLAAIDGIDDPYPHARFDSDWFDEDSVVFPEELPSNADRQKRALNNLLRAARGDSTEPIDDESDPTRSDSYQTQMERARSNYKRRGKGVQRSDASDSRDRGRPMPRSGAVYTIGHGYY